MTLNSKQLADIITWARTLLAPLLIWLGFAYGPDALPAVTVILVLNLTGDSIDGPLARRSPDSPGTWIGDNDLAVDMFVTAGLLGYMTAAGLIPWPVTAVYALFWLVLFWWRGVVYVFGILFQGPIYAWYLYVLLRDAAPYSLLFVAWLLAALIISWPKFPKVMIPLFLGGIRDLVHRRSHERDVLRKNEE
jgi:hypothetical protein